jgi:prepilin-type N-terminal cleavage/methylation domain-containing protein
VRHLPPRTAGFTLIELAVVLFVLGLLIAGLIRPVQVQLEARDRRSTIDTMREVAEAMYGYAVIHGRLPCPTSADSLNGTSEPAYDGTLAGASCPDSGFVPWAELGVRPVDAWSNRFSYRVTSPAFTWPAQDLACNGNENATLELDICAEGDIEIHGRSGKSLMNHGANESIVAVIVSHGRNGYGAIAGDGTERADAPGSHADEIENYDGDEVFMDRGYSSDQSGCDDDSSSAPLCEFDDILMPISRSILISRLVAAGRLP